MKFDNQAFERGVRTTMGTLSKLKQGLNFLPEKRAIDALQTAGNKFSLKGMGDGIGGISAKFLALSTVGITALANITNRAVDAGINMAKSFTIAPLIDGLHEYEKNLKSTQTIAANTGLEGEAGLAKVNATLDEMNAFSDQTIYNFSEMANNLGTFTAAGVKLDTAASAIKGIANLAALSGSSSEQASTAMYQLSQAIAAGKVGLQDWNSVVNAGMGGAKFQGALVNTAVAMGAIDKNVVKLNKSTGQLKINGASFRESLMAKPGQSSWLSSEVLVNTLASLDGRFSKTALAVQGYDEKQIQAKLNASRLALEQKNGVKYTDAQFRALTKMADAAFKSATEVKTLGGVFDVAKEAMGSGWAATWRIIFGDLGQAKTLFTGVSTTVNGFINKMSEARNSVLRDWAELGGRSVLIEGIGNIFQALGAIIKPIGQAFRDIFPPATGKNLYDMSVAFRDFTESLIISKDTAEGIRGIFGGVFAVLRVGIAIVVGLARYFFDLVLIVGQLVAPLLRLAGAIADLFSGALGGVDLAGMITKFFDVIIEGRRAALTPLIEGITWVIDKITELVELVDGALTAAFGKLAPVADRVFGRIGSGLTTAKNVVKDFVSSLDVGDKLKGVMDFDISGEGVKEAASGAASGASGAAASVAQASSLGEKASVVWEKVSAVLGRVLGVVGREIKDFGGFMRDGAKDVWDFVSSLWSGLGGVAGDIAGGLGTVLSKIGPILGNVFDGIQNLITGFFDDMDFQDGLAVVNTGFFIAFYSMMRSFLKSIRGLADSVGGAFDNLGGMFGQVTGNLKTMQTDVRSNIILKIAAALLLLSVALFILSKIPANQLKTGLGTVAGLMVTLAAALVTLEKTTTTLGAANMALLSVSMIGLGIALLSMAAAVAIFGRMKPETLKQGLISVALVVTGMVAAAAILSKTGGAASILVASFALGVLSVALTALAGAIKLYSSMDTGGIVEGAAKMIGIVVGLGLALSVMPPSVLASAAALVLVSGALVVLAGVLKILASVSGGDTFQSLILLGGALGIIVLAMMGMQGALAGAAALWVVSNALVMLATAMKILGSLSIGETLIALGALAGVFVILGLAGVILAPVVPIILLLGVAIGLLGAGALMAGAGLLLFATGLASLVVSGAAGIAVLTAAIIAVAELFPLVMQQIGLGIVAFAKVISDAGPPLLAAFTAVLMAMIGAVIKITPKLGNMLITMIRTGLKVIRKTFPDIVKTGMQMIDNILTGIDRNIVKFTNKAVSIVTKFVNTLSKRANIDKFINAGENFIVNLGKGVIDKVGSVADRLYEKCKEIGSDIVAGVVKGIGNGASSAINAVIDLGEDMLSSLTSKLKIKSPSRAFAALSKWIPRGVAVGVNKEAHVVDESMAAMATSALDTLAVGMRGASSIIDGVVDTNPRIVPVLDLTKMSNEASKINGLLSANPIYADISAKEAATLFDEVEDARGGQDDGPGEGGGDVIFNQTVNSPRELAPNVVYRQTHSQLEFAKAELRKKP